tara:strand:+ start:707 stop:1606 length:900 start_codon:yes stop_codon:yes gene_type:complete
MAKLSNDVSKFVLKFLQENNNENISELWNKVETQKNLKKILNGKKTKNTDPEKPRKIKSAYLFYCDEYRQKLRDENPNLSFKEVTKLMGNIWSTIKKDKEKIKKYIELYEQDIIRYEKEMKAYSPTGKYAIVKGSNKDPNKPKRPFTHYIFYCNENRKKIKKEMPKLNHKEIVKELGNRWKEIKNDSDKTLFNKYLELSEKDKKRYSIEMKKYLQNDVTKEEEVENTEEEVEKTEEVVEKTEEVVEQKFTAYQLYCNDNRTKFKEQYPLLKPKQITRELAKSWKSLDKKVKKKYKKLAK